MKISFCTTCMGRTHHLKQTLPKNIRENLPRADKLDPDVEFVVLDYNSQDGLEEWIKSDPEMIEYMRKGILVYARTTEPQSFRMAHAKNMAHRLAKGDVLCNTDADNFLGPHFATELAHIFQQNPQVIVHPARILGQNISVDERGFFGRIAVTRKGFYDLGGYNENRFKGWGCEDSHFLLRAYAIGLKPYSVFDKSFFETIGHGDSERIQNMADKETSIRNLRRCDESYVLRKASILRNQFYMALSFAQSNRDGDFGCGRVETGLEAREQILQPVITHPSYLKFAFNGISGFLESKAQTSPSHVDLSHSLE